MKFQMEITKPFCNVSWCFNSCVEADLDSRPGPGLAGGGGKAGFTNLWLRKATCAWKDPTLHLNI